MPFIAVDIGNTRTKFAVFDGNEAAFPASLEDALELLLAEDGSCLWLFARTGSENEQRRIVTFIQQHRPQDTVEEFTSSNILATFPLKMNVDAPERIGVDRLMAALAAERYTEQLRDIPKLILDVGSAVTLDFVSANGCFEGGAIMPGLTAAAKSLTEISAKLPLVTNFESADDSAVYPGKDTVSAIRAGLCGQIIGAACLCYKKVAVELDVPVPLFLTGGDAPVLYGHLSKALPEQRIIHVPDLVLRGIALCRFLPFGG